MLLNTSARSTGKVVIVKRRPRLVALCVVVLTALWTVAPTGPVAAHPTEPTAVIQTSAVHWSDIAVLSAATSDPADGAGPASQAAAFPATGTVGRLAVMALVLLSAAVAVTGFTRLAFRGVLRARES